MAINFPTSLDDFANPASTDSLNTPSHSLQHTDLNDAVEALQAKVGIGASPAGSATAGQVLTAQGGGTALWTTPDSGGLVLINTTSFSGVSSQSVSDVFSATYQSYLVQADLVNVSTANNVSIRMRVSGADNSTANYRKQYIIAGGSTVIAARSVNQTSWNAIMIATNAYESLNVIEIHYPFETKNTEAYAKFISSPRGDIEIQHMTAGFNGTTSFTGFTLIADAGTITGTVRTYGYNQ